MQRELALEFARVTEAAAIAAYYKIGMGNKEEVDKVAVEAMRTMLNTMSINGEVVIGEGEIDEAPMLYIGEKVGIKDEENSKVDIAVDPVEGTRMVAVGQANAIAVLAVGEKNSFLKAPDMYMEKLVVGPKAKGKIDLDKTLIENIEIVAKANNKKINELVIMILDKPRHRAVIKQLQEYGVRVFAFPDGDVAASIATCLEETEVDMMYGIGGAPEGVISAAVIRTLGGDMQARLKLRSDVKGQSLDNDKISKDEKRRCSEKGLKVGEVLKIDDLAKDDNIIFSATGITSGDLLKGVTRKNNIVKTETLLVRGNSKTVRYINAVHNVLHKDKQLQELFK